MNNSLVLKTLSESQDSNDSEKSEVCRSVQLMAELEQEVTPETNVMLGDETEPQSRPSVPAERVPAEEWAKMSKTQRKHYLRKRREMSGEANRATSGKPRAEGSSKRPRDATSFTPSPNKEERKKPKIEAPRYSHVVSCAKVAIVKEGHPNEELTEEDGEKLLMKLMELMRESKPEEGSLNFCGHQHRLGAIVIGCVDEGSRQWLIRSVEKLTPWEGIPLKTCDPKGLEGFKKVSMFIPGQLRKVEDIMVHLKRQNDLDTSKWKVMPAGVKEHRNGVYIVISIPESHFKRIQEKNMRIYYGFTFVEVKELGKEKKEGGPAEREKGEESGERMGVGEERAVDAAGVAAPVELPFDASARPGRPGADLRPIVLPQSSGGRRLGEWGERLPLGPLPRARLSGLAGTQRESRSDRAGILRPLPNP